MKSLLNWNEKNRRNRERSLRLESLEDRMLLAVTAGEAFAAAELAAPADPMATEAIKLEAPENIVGTCTTNSRQTLTWDAVAGASGYVISYNEVGSTTIKTKEVTTNSANITGAQYTKVFEYRIMAKGDGTNYTNSDYSETVKLMANTAYTTVVTTLDDIAASATPTANETSLRQAIYFASKTNTTVTFADGLQGTIDLASNGQIGKTEINGSFSLDGDNRITIVNTNTDGRGRLFYFLGGREGYDFSSTITFQDITLSTSDATGYNGGDNYLTEWEGNGWGSAILYFAGYATDHSGGFVLDNVTVNNSISSGRAPVYLWGLGSVTVTNSNFTGNQGSEGGSLHVGSTTNLTIADCTFTENVSTSSGGGVHLDDAANVAIDNTKITNNKVYAQGDDTYRGGGLYITGNYKTPSVVTLHNTEITDNFIGVDPNGTVEHGWGALGGGVFLANCNFTTHYSTISRNTATNSRFCTGGGIYQINKDEWGYEYSSMQNTSINLFHTYVCDNLAGSLKAYEGSPTNGSGGAIYSEGSNVTLFGCAVTGNTIQGAAPNGMVANAVYTYNATSAFFSYYTTYAGNKTYSLDGGGLSKASGAFREWGNTYYFGSVFLGNLVVNMNGTLEDTGDDVVTENNFYTFALEENGTQLPRFMSCALNKSTMNYTDFNNPEWHYTLDLYSYGSYYDDAGYTQLSESQAKNGGPYLYDDNVQVDDYVSFFNDYAKGDYTLAKSSAGVDAFNMDHYGGGLGYKYDIRGEGYDRIVNEIVDIGAYELQTSKTFEVTVEGWTGSYDGKAHSVTVSNTQEGDVVYYSADGETYDTEVISYTDPGTYKTYVKVTRAGYEDFYGSADVVINAAVTKLSVRVVVSNTQASATEVAALPSSITSATIGDTIYAQVWIKNADASELGCTGGYVNLEYSDANITVGSYITSAIYASQATMYSAKTAGLVETFGGCAETGVNDLAVSEWALLGTFSFTASVAGNAEISASAATYKGTAGKYLNPARAGQGNFETSEIDFGSAVSFTVSAGGGEKLAAPKITTGSKGVYVSYGANRHQVQWGAVANASGYELAYSNDGSTWKTVTVTETSAVVTGLTYGDQMYYKVRALGSGSYTDSDFSAVTDGFYVCPMDINGDTDIAGADRNLMAASWNSEEGDEDYRYYADINGDGDVSGADRNFLASNWNLNVEDDFEDLVYPKALNASDAAFTEFASALDTDLEVF